VSGRLRDSVFTRAAAPEDLLEVFGWLDRDPVVNVYPLALVLRDRLRAPRDEFWVAQQASRITGIVYIGAASGAILPVAEDDQTRTALAARIVDRVGAVPERFQLVGPRADVEVATRALTAAGIPPRMERAQIYMSLPREQLVRFERLPALRRAQPDDLALVFETGADLRAEELGEDPRHADPEGYAGRVEDECRNGYTWLWIEEGTLRFRASLSALTADAVQISGVYTPPAQRNHGYAQRGLAELLTRQFERTRAACLFVNDFNAPAIAVYRRLGFRHAADWASIFYDRRAPRP
jgi:uncharacterized protein